MKASFFTDDDSWSNIYSHNNNVAFCTLALATIGFSGNISDSRKIYMFVRGYLADKGFSTGCFAYRNILDMCDLAGTPSKYLSLLSWQLGMILALNSFIKPMPASAVYPLCER
ncbi:hypothetical protein [Nostoc sp. TCL240-02]|uniref:hypothetical protein n=1 Tax=Nostoc sp. TCL240-02 TaxID=2572090 RepID=UPI00157FA499|nr:hypothetical protein [Nostoc sp. TCL240-02]QKQ76355.1 hypothetical protein FBB35_26460 [Nostoc sp. TCL240-02]